mgnify:CR=1 FL=1
MILGGIKQCSESKVLVYNIVMVDRKKLVQKFNDIDVKQKEQLGQRTSFKYRKKQKMLKQLEGKDYQAGRVEESGRSCEVKVYRIDRIEKA